MAITESFINVTEGSGKKAHFSQRTIGANDVHDEFVVPGEFPYVTYRVSVNGISIATANDHLLQIMAGASLNVRVRWIELRQQASATTAALDSIQLLRLTTAGTGGTAVTPARLNTADGAAGATAMTLPTVKGTESTEIDRDVLVCRQAIAATATQTDGNYLRFDFTRPNEEPLIIAAGTANGVAVKGLSAIAAGTVMLRACFVETNFV